MKKKILIVDDEQQIVKLIAIRLMANNYEVITANDGYQCVQVAKMELPDLILLDIKMPLQGGIKAFKINKLLYIKEKLKNLLSTSLLFK